MPNLPGRRDFLGLIKDHLQPEELRKVKHAYLLAKVAHQGQTRDEGVRYFDHPKSVALILIGLGIYDWEMLVAALDHDVIEDTDLRDRELYEDLFGPWVAAALQTLSKHPDRDYLAGLQTADWRVLAVKMADRLHNLRTLKFVAAEKKQWKLTETRTDYLPLADRMVEIAPDDMKPIVIRLREEVIEALASA